MPAVRFWVLAVLLLPHSGVLAKQAVVSCHLHVPSDSKTFSKQPLVLPAVGDAADCAGLNRDRFGSRGRCHCFSDAPGGADMRAPDYSGDGLPASILP